MRIRIKAQVEQDNVPKAVEDFTRERFAPNKVLDIDDKQGKALVDGGFADRVDSRGYVVDPAAEVEAGAGKAAKSSARVTNVEDEEILPSRGHKAAETVERTGKRSK